MQLRIKKAFITGAIAAGLAFMAWSDLMGKEKYVQYIMDHWVEWDSFLSLAAYAAGLIIIIRFFAMEWEYHT